jgi:predicted RNA-binding Zn ribbon-like protein
VPLSIAGDRVDITDTCDAAWYVNVPTERHHRAPPGSRQRLADRARRTAAGRLAPDAPASFHLGHGSLCLDFANTVSWRGSGAPVDHLLTYAALVRFAEQSKLLSEDEGRRLRHEAARRPEAATRVWRKAVALREALYRTFAGLAGGRSPRAADLEILNASLPSALVQLRLAAGDGGFAWQWKGDPQALDRLIWPVARDAAVFLTSADLSRLRTCGNPQCRWLFHDGTRSGTRRWCSMAVCGNRAKVRRYYARSRAPQGGSTA